MWAMRQHYEHTALDARYGVVDAGPFHSPYRQRSIVFSDPANPSNQYAFNRNLGYVGTFFHFVAHCRSPSSVAAGSVIWFGVDDASLSVRVPLYAKSRRAPSTWSYGVGSTGEFAHSAYWRFNTVANWAYSKHNLIAADVQARVVSTESALFADVAETDRQ
jgi:dipeptidase